MAWKRPPARFRPGPPNNTNKIKCMNYQIRKRPFSNWRQSRSSLQCSASLFRAKACCYFAGLRRYFARLCFATDPYSPCDSTLTRKSIEVLCNHRLAFCTHTKGGSQRFHSLKCTGRKIGKLPPGNRSLIREMLVPAIYC